MRLYLSKGRHWTGTQADAKAAQGGSNAYETIEVPDAKPARLAWLNDQWARLLGDKPAADPQPLHVEVQPVATPEPAAPCKAPCKADTYPAERRANPDWQSDPHPEDCQRCKAMSKASRSIEGIMALTNIEWAISQADWAFLRRIEIAVADRQLELLPKTPAEPPSSNEPAAALPAPRPRVRVRPAVSSEVELPK